MDLKWWRAANRPPILLLLLFAASALLGGVNLVNGMITMREGTEASQMGILNVIIGGLFIYIAWSLLERRSWAWSVAIAYLLYKFIVGTIYVVMNLMRAPDFTPIFTAMQLLFALALWYLFTPELIHFYGLKHILQEKSEARERTRIKEKPKPIKDKSPAKDKTSAKDKAEKAPPPPPSLGIPLDIRKPVFQYAAPFPTVVTIGLLLASVIMVATAPQAPGWSSLPNAGRKLGNIAVSADGNAIYATRTPFWGQSTLVKSSDGGETWNDTKFPGDSVWELWLDPTDASRLYVLSGGGKGMYLFEKEAWQRLTPETTQPHAMLIEPGSPERVYIVAYKKGILYTDDRGATWQESKLESGAALAAQEQNQNTPAPSVTPTPVAEVACLARDAAHGYIYAGTWQRGLFRSRDRGQSWQELPGVTEKSHVRLVVSADGELIISVPASAISAEKPRFSADGGETWQLLNTPADDADEYIITPGNGVLLTSVTSGIYWSTDLMQTWQSLGPHAITISSLAYAAGAQRLFASSFNVFRFTGILTRPLLLPTEAETMNRRPPAAPAPAP